VGHDHRWRRLDERARRRARFHLVGDLAEHIEAIEGSHQLLERVVQELSIDATPAAMRSAAVAVEAASLRIVVAAVWIATVMGRLDAHASLHTMTLDRPET
jgi:hypothetical protein